MLVDIELLKRLGACVEHQDVFASEFPEGLNITGDPDDGAIARIVDARLDVRWLCKRALTAPAWAEYERVRAQAWAEYRRVTAAAWAEYERVTAVTAWRLLANPGNILPPHTEKGEE